MSKSVRFCSFIWLCIGFCVAATQTVAAQPGADSVDARANLTEYRLNEINAELEASRPASPALPGMDKMVSPGNPAGLVTNSSGEAVERVKRVEAEISSSLHRLYRETLEVKKPGARENVIEAKQKPQQ